MELYKVIAVRDDQVCEMFSDNETEAENLFNFFAGAKASSTYHYVAKVNIGGSVPVVEKQHAGLIEGGAVYAL